MKLEIVWPRRGGIRRQPDLWARRRWLDEGRRCYTEATRGRIRLMIVTFASFVFMCGCIRCHPPPASVSHPSPSSSSIPLLLCHPLLLPLRLLLALIFLSSSSALFFYLSCPSSPLSSLFFIFLYLFLSSSRHYYYHSSFSFSLSSFLLPLPPRHSSFISHVLRLLVLLLRLLRGRGG